jgi:type III pantothenate kinase
VRAIVVDVGSAVTVDLVAGRVFRGGLIMPGAGLGLWALGRYARRLPKIDAQRLSVHFPKRFDDTEPSMILGVNLGMVGAIREAVRELHRASGGSPTVFVTGGGARPLLRRLPGTWKWDPHLVSKGLYHVWEINAVRGRAP